MAPAEPIMSLALSTAIERFLIAKRSETVPPGPSRRVATPSG